MLSIIPFQLKALVDNGLVERKQYESIPPKVEYSLTEIGKNPLQRLLLSPYPDRMLRPYKTGDTNILSIYKKIRNRCQPIDSYL